MKKRINLLSKKKHFSRVNDYAQKIKKFGAIFGVFFFILFFIVVIQTILYKNKVADLTKKKQLYLSLLVDQKDIEANTRFFKGKLTQLNKYAQDDAHFLPYYSVLLNAINLSSQSAMLDMIDISKTRSTTFVVKFNDYNGMVAFLKYVESPDFLKNFDDLSMASLNLSRELEGNSRGNSPLSKNYQLQFQGTFKQLNDKVL